LEKLNKLVEKVMRDASLRVERITPCSRLREDLGMDSIALVDLMVELEGVFDIWFDPLNPQLPKAFHSMETLSQFIAGSQRRGS
jgi:acyl carrier protein